MSNTKDKKKAKAHAKFFYATKIGKIERPDKCTDCGKTEKELGAKIHGHHKDYDKPLEVVWLCSSCHKKHHSVEPGHLYSKKYFSEAGKRGAAAKHRKRYEALVELSKYIAKGDLDRIQSKWPTEMILRLVIAYKHDR